MTIRDFGQRYFAEILWLIILFYILIAFAPPTLYKLGYENAGNKIESVYRIFCHQRVERSMFLWGSEGPVKFYSIEELQYLDVIPEENPYVNESLNEEIFAYPYVGNDFVGYKVALCIRDISIYLAMLAVGLAYLIIANRSGKIRKYNWKLLIVIMVPMAVDGTFQLISEVMRWDWVPDAYYASIWKRIITGGLFGIGFALLIFPNMKENAEFLYNDSRKGKSGNQTKVVDGE